MKSLVLCNSDMLSIPALQYLQQQEKLAGIVVPERSVPLLLPVFEESGLRPDQVLSVKKAELESRMEELLHSLQPDLLLCLTFPWKLPQVIAERMSQACINFHFGLLPKYKGADPVFWQLKNGERMGGITAHLMTDEIDSGPVILQKHLPVIPGENYGIHSQRLGLLAREILPELMTVVGQNKGFVPDTSSGPSDYYKAPDYDDLTIRWDFQSADEIQCLINAANPRYGGGLTSFRNKEMRLLEVTPADLANIPAQPPGTIVYADALYGLVVQCINGQYLQLNVARLDEGYFSGGKLFNLGFRTGERFV